MFFVLLLASFFFKDRFRNFSFNSQKLNVLKQNIEEEKIIILYVAVGLEKINIYLKYSKLYDF